MKKYIFSLILTLMVNLCISQQFTKSHNLNWELAEIQNSDQKILSSKNSYFNHEEGVPYFIYSYKVPNTSSNFESSIVNTVYTPLSEEEKRHITIAHIPDNISIQNRIAISRKIPNAQIKFIPLRNNNGIIEKLTSFDIEINVNEHNNFQSLGRVRNGYVANSILNQGTWFQIAVSQDGVYRITYEYLKNNGIDVTNIKSDNINVYGNHQGMLAEDNSADRIDDLAKNAIIVEDGGDGIFNSGDYILFYASSAHKWRYQNSSNRFVYDYNVYTDKATYFVTTSDNSGAKRINTESQAAGVTTHNVNTFNDFRVIEKDEYNILNEVFITGSGREWYGDLYDNVLTYSYPFVFPNIESSSPAFVSIRAAAASLNASSSFTVSGDANGSISIGMVNGGWDKFHVGIANLTINNPSQNINVNLTFNKGTGSARGWLDFIEVNARRNLILASNQMIFRDANSVGTGNISEFTISNAFPITQIWDVTSPMDISSIDYSNNGNSKTFKVNTDNLRTFIAISGTNFSSPEFVKVVENQDIHGLPFADLLIVTHPSLLSAAQDLADFHLNERGITSHVVTVDQVYNEFSSGMQDIMAIRLFAKLFYDKAGNNPSQAPKSLLLFGDASYDYKDRTPNNTNLVIGHQSITSNDYVRSFSADDFFAILDSNESFLNSDMVDIAVGRLSVKNLSEAQIAVNKIKNYLKTDGVLPGDKDCCNGTTNSSALGDWRNTITFIADDEDNNVFFNDNEGVINNIEQNYPSFNPNKIYLDAYTQTSTPGGERYSEVNEAITRSVQNGTLLVSYVGHGGETGWAHERILDNSTINSWTNANRLALFMTATCEFSRFDDPYRTSAGELAFLNPNGGAIALFTTTRAVLITANSVLNRIFFEELFEETNNRPRTLGEVYIETKNNFLDGENRKFSLLGDPTLPLSIPKHQVVTTEINNTSITATDIDTIKALSQITIKGQIEDRTGNLLSNFNGTVYPTVFDKRETLFTRGNDPASSVLPFEVRNKVIFKGRATVTNGEFEFSFIAPIDINLSYGTAKISYYAEDGTEDAQGYEERIVIGGINTAASQDGDGPTVSLYLNEENFVPGGVTNQTPILYAEISDQNGINTTGNGIGHDISVVLDDNTANTIVLNQYYEAEQDSYQRGKVIYPFSELEEGNHTLDFTVWDVYNNPSKVNMDFLVVRNEKIAIDHVLNYPNPFTTNTQFMFEHNQACNFLEVQVQIYTISGKLMKTINTLARTEGYRVNDIKWDGKDDFGSKLARGVYVYKLKVKNEDGESTDKLGKLVILN